MQKCELTPKYKIKLINHISNVQFHIQLLDYRVEFIFFQARKLI